MGMPAARPGDQVLQTGPHCHAPIHPPAPVPTPIPHPPIPLTIISGEFTVLLGGQPAARLTDTTTPCTLVPCVPAGPGMIVQGATSVLIGKMPAARAIARRYNGIGQVDYYSSRLEAQYRNCQFRNRGS